MLVTLHRQFDIARPRVQRGQSSRPSAGSSLPAAAKGWLLSVAALRRAFFASPSPHLNSTARDGDALTYPEQMAALGRVVVSTRGVLAAQAHVAAHKAARGHSH